MNSFNEENMRVILLEKVKNLGVLGNQVEVKPGYARNYLVPQKKAVYATAVNIELFEKQRAELEKKMEQSKAIAQEKTAHLNDVMLLLNVMASDEGKLYGSVGAAEIQNALKAKGFEVAKKEIILPEGPLHYLGDYLIEIHLHSDVVAKLQVQLVAEKSKK